MLGDEVMVLMVAICTIPFLLVSWYRDLFSIPALVCPIPCRWPMWAGPIVCLVALLIVLRTLAANDVRNAPMYILMYAALGIAWVGILRKAAYFFGFYPRQDIVERRNPAARWLYPGLLLGLTLCYAGGNIGSGPGWWVVVFCGGLATMALFAIWAVLEHFLALTERVTIHRDVAVGLRLGAILVACGLVLGRAVAGDWESVPATVRDFVKVGWPVLGFVVVELLIGSMTAPRPGRPTAPVTIGGIVPGALYLLLAAGYVDAVGGLP